METMHIETLLRELLSTQDMGKKGIEKVLDKFYFPDGKSYDPISMIIIWAIECGIVNRKLDIATIEMNFEYAINQLQKAKEKLSEVNIETYERA
jgi:hypothetical protein